MISLAIDIGGTFTDLIAYERDTGRFFSSKSLTTYSRPTDAIIDCIRKSDLDAGAATEMIHGTTIAINTLIERKGAKVGLLVTQGTRDVYAIGRGNRPEAYNLFFHRPRPLVPRDRIVEAEGRLLASGAEWRPLDELAVRQAARRFAGMGVEAVAVCFLHSYANPMHEQIAGRILREELPDCYVSLSHEILREYREYERTSTTAVNAYIGPRVSSYVAKLKSDVGKIGFAGDLAIMQSNGGVMSPQTAMSRPVTMMESGPVGGIIASAAIGRHLGFDDVIAFDMGGTTAKASLVKDGAPAMAEGYYVGGYASGDAVMTPVVDVVEIGAGGGSIAWRDEIGALRVGPHSASSEPGPIAYGRGGERPTITDANIVLGRIGTTDFLGGEMRLDHEAAVAGIDRAIASPMGLTPISAAQAIIRIAVSHMSLAVRAVSVERGYDPRDFVMVASGGAGPLHAASVARELHIPKVVVPRFPSQFSALGMLMADERHDLVRTRQALLNNVPIAELLAIRDEMLQEARELVQDTAAATYQLHFDLRYVGQEFALSVPIPNEVIEAGDRDAIKRSFNAMHEHRYAHSAADEELEIINVRLVALSERRKIDLPQVASAERPQPVEIREFYPEEGTSGVPSPVYRREDLGSGTCLDGPVLVVEYGTTTVVHAGDSLLVADTGELIITVGNY